GNRITPPSGEPTTDTLSNGQIYLGTISYECWFDDVKVWGDDIITINNLQNGQNITLYNETGIFQSSAISSGGPTTLNVAALDFPFKGFFNITDMGGTNVIYTSDIYPDIWGNDTFELISPSIPSFQFMINGSYISTPHDFGSNVTSLGQITWNATTRLGTSVGVRTRTANEAVNLTSAQWSNSYNNGDIITSPHNRWIQYQVIFNTTNAAFTPILSDITINATFLPNFNVVKTVNRTTVAPNGFLNYTIYFNNTGFNTALDVWINDTLPANVTFITSSAEANRTGFSWHFNNVSSNTENNFTIQVQVNANAGDQSTILNRAHLDYVDAGGQQLPGFYSNDVITTVKVPDLPIFEFSKTVDNTIAEPGDYLTYTIYYNNTGLATARNVWVNDTLAPGLTFVSSTAEANRTGSVWNFQYIGSATQNSFSITARVDLNLPNGTELNNSAQLNYTDQNDISKTGLHTNQVTTLILRPIITIEKSADLSVVEAGQNIEYTIYYNNTGSKASKHVWLNETLVPGRTFVTSSAETNRVGSTT
ncbi:MAG: DUF11 domain-containing protein, partial [Thermoplasmata archaeon]|nr:DUF11 domain-containing protein [Thermoplasmata archaeon]